MKRVSAASLDADGQNPDVTGLFRISASDLRPIETLFRNTVENAPIGIAFANPDGGFRHANLAFCAMLGYSAEELKNESVTSLTHGSDLETTRTGLARLWRGEVTHLDVEKRYIRKDGGALWVRVTTSLVHGGAAAPECTVEFVRDISKRKETVRGAAAEPDTPRHRVRRAAARHRGL